ncbi:MAG: CoA transferase [Pseudomonadota bacterium]
MPEATGKQGPLAGIRVLELAHVMAGPTCGRILADLGAEVIKLERLEGEDCRRMAPPWVGEEAASFLMLNRNKQAVAANLKTADGREILRRLALDSDVLIENFRPGTMEKFGAGYDELAKQNPALIYCAISGFGRTGPYARRGGFDLVAQAMSGVMSVTGENSESPPIKAGVPISDVGAGLYAVIGILAALESRHKTGRGQQVDTSLFEAAVSFMSWPIAMQLASGEAPPPLGSAHPLDAPYQAFEASDGWFVVAAANQANWLRLVEVLGEPGLLEDSRFADNPDRVANQDALIEVLKPIFKQRPKDEWMVKLEGAGIPCGPINSVADVLEDPQLAARGMLCDTWHRDLGPLKTLNTPLTFSASQLNQRHGAPALGEDTVAILRRAGFSASDIQEMLERGSIHVSETSTDSAKSTARARGQA